MDRRDALRVTIRAIRLSRACAERGRTEAAKRAWRLACRCAFRCGGLSGCSLGGAFILVSLPRRPDYVAYCPVKL